MINLKHIFIIFIVISCSILLHADASRLNLRIYYLHRPPYYETLPDNIPDGFLIKIFKLVMEDAGIDYELIEAPPKRILEILKKEDGAGSLGWFIASDREDIYLFSDSIYQDQENVFIIRKDLFPNEAEIEIADLLSSEHRLTIVDGFSYGDWYDQKIEEYCKKTDPINSIPLNIAKMIAYSRTDYTIMGREEALWIIDNYPDIGEKVTILSIKNAPQGNTRHIMFNKNTDKDTIESINSSISSIRESEAYKLLKSRYE